MISLDYKYFHKYTTKCYFYILWYFFYISIWCWSKVNIFQFVTPAACNFILALLSVQLWQKWGVFPVRLHHGRDHDRQTPGWQAAFHWTEHWQCGKLAGRPQFQLAGARNGRGRQSRCVLFPYFTRARKLIQQHASHSITFNAFSQITCRPRVPRGKAPRRQSSRWLTTGCTTFYPTGMTSHACTCAPCGLTTAGECTTPTSSLG